MSEELLRKKNEEQCRLVQKPLFKKIVGICIGHAPSRSECMGWFISYKLSYLYAKWFTLKHRKELHAQN